MTHYRRLSAAMAAAALMVLSTTAAAQVKPVAHDWSYGTMLSVSGGAGFDSDHTGPLAGVGLGWEVLPWFALEGSGTWLDRGRAATGFAADMKAVFGLTHASAVVPYVTGGVGLYHASYNPVRSTVPEFYRRRMMMTAPAEPGVTSTFTDPTIVLGGGFNLYVTEHAALRPGVETAIVMGDSRRHPVTTVALRMTYHFEDHPITPGR